MRLVFHKMLHAGVIVSAVFKRVWEGIEEVFCSKAALARRAEGRFEALKRRELENERLDRLRHPSKYQGR